MAPKKKDFTNINTNPVYSAIAEATTEPMPGQMELQADGTASEVVTEPRKERKGYTGAEKEEFLTSLKTAGHKGCKLPRINLAFSPSNYDYVRTMARVQGVTITEFCNKVIAEYAEENKELYNKAIEFRNSL